MSDIVFVADTSPHDIDTGVDGGKEEEILRIESAWRQRGRQNIVNESQFHLLRAIASDRITPFRLRGRI